MTFKERLFHAIVFELGALLVSAVAVVWVGDFGAHTALGLGVAISLTAVLWNFVFNYFFDRVFTGRREKRSLKIRAGHTLGFEGGLLALTVPMVAYALDLSWWQAILADLSLSALIVVYTFFFNWAYDVLRVRFVS